MAPGDGPNVFPEDPLGPLAIWQLLKHFMIKILFSFRPLSVFKKHRNLIILLMSQNNTFHLYFLLVTYY